MSKVKGKKKTVQETYQLLTPIEHVLKRPDTYVGSLDKQTEIQWVLNEDSSKFIQKTLTYSPALYKIYDEVLVNAADSYQRDRSMNYLSIEIDEQNGYVKVHNNGKGIPIVIHQGQDMYVPEMIFGHLFTGSNFDDEKDKRFGGGRNGFGAKLANILSNKFSVFCGDNQNRKEFFMTWTNNMGDKVMPRVKDYKGKDFVEIMFYPDFKRFGMERFQSDIVELFKKRAYDMAGVLPKVKVLLNGKEINIKSFSNYVDMYLHDEDENPPVKITAGKNQGNEHWEVILSRSDGEMKQVSFVNGICTYKGGTHTNYILDQIVPKISDKLKNASIKPQFIKSKLFIFINCLIVNPKFDSQLKETLTTRPNVFGSSWDMPQKMIKAMLATGIVEQLAKEAEARQMTKMAKATGGAKKSRVDVPKLEDANDAGKKDSEKCVLILTEGDSAKALAVSGLSVLGRDKYGVFPLRGKLLNVREKEKKVVLQNAEISNIVKIIGLQYNKQYTDLKSLRYGSIMIMTDQDSDGSHIKGLIINFIQYYWPTLFKTNGFLREFITPLLKVTKGSNVESFFSIQEFNAWKDATPNHKTWKVKYYKGLGTSTSKEGQEYFKNINIHEKVFRYQDDDDNSKIDLAFSKKKTDQRKEWLATYNQEDIIDLTPSIKEIRYKDFIDKELIHFSNSSNKRAIPSMIDGFKPGQRKILFACFKRNLKEEIKVAQLAGYVAEHSAYHHGEMSLTQTIIMLAQNYVGSNNINLLMPNGQFGSRSEGGDDHASARYVFTCLNKVTRTIFPQPDDHTLKYLEDDGQIVEPEYYIPIIPMVLVNGAEGLGTGWSTSIPNYNPRELVAQIKKRINGEVFTEILPWWKGFDGQIVPIQNGIKTRGIVNDDTNDRNTVHITQLPVGKWTAKFKQELIEHINKQKHIVGFKEYHTSDKVHFEIEFQDEYMNQQQAMESIFNFLKLSSTRKFTNMVAFNSTNFLERYATVTAILDQFYAIRLACYDRRKQYLISKIKREVEISSMKVRFILAVIDKKIQLRNAGRGELCALLLKEGYTKFSEFTVVSSTKKGGAQKKQKQEEGNEEEKKPSKKSKTGKEQENKLFSEYNYLLGMPLWTLTAEKVQQLVQELKENEEELNILVNTKEATMWIQDLDNFLKVLDEVQEEERKERLKADELAKGNKGKNKKIGRRIRKPKNKNGEEEVSESDADEKKKKGKRSPSSTRSKATKESNTKGESPEQGKKRGRKPKESSGSQRNSSSKQKPEKDLAADTPYKQIVKGVKNQDPKNSKDLKQSSKPKVEVQPSKQSKMSGIFSKYLGKGVPKVQQSQRQMEEKVVDKLAEISKKKENEERAKDHSKHQPAISEDDEDEDSNVGRAKIRKRNKFQDEES